MHWEIEPHTIVNLSLYNIVIGQFFENNLTLTCIIKQKHKISIIINT